MDRRLPVLIMTWIIWRSVLAHMAELGSALTALQSLDCCYQLLPLSTRAITNTAMYFCILHYWAPCNLFCHGCFDVRV